LKDRCIKKINQDAFTLIEIIIVVIILGIIASLGIPKYTGMYEKTRLGEGVQTLGVLRGAQKRYFLENDSYATALNNLDVTIGTMKYFKDVKAANNASATSYVAQLTRSDDSYTLSISTDGTYSCTGDPCSGFRLN